MIRSRQNKYSLGGWGFDVEELKLPIDAISSSKFITAKKSTGLIQKLATLTSEYNAEKLRRNVTVEGRVKSDNNTGTVDLDKSVKRKKY